MTLEGAVGIALCPDQPLQCLERGLLAIFLDPLEERGDRIVEVGTNVKADGAKVIGGPAPRRLAALPLKIVDGQLIVAGVFTGRLGASTT